MSIALSRRKIATLLTLIGLVAGGLYLTSGGQPTASAATNGHVASIHCIASEIGAIPGPGAKVNGTTGLALVSTSDVMFKPYDVASGAPTGQVTHKPYIFTLSSSASSATADANVLLTEAMVNNNTLKTCTFRYFDLNQAGVTQTYLTVVLTNAQLTSYSFSGNGTVQWAATYQKITWATTSKSAVDDWQVPAA